MAEKDTVKTFAEGMSQLEQVVQELESGELPLEQALAAFEAGVGLVRVLNQRLSAAEAQVDVLTRDADGNLQLEAPLRPQTAKE